MNSTTAPRYGFAPQVPFAATRACAERRARETAAVAAPDGPGPRPARALIRRLTRRRVPAAS